MLTVGSEEEKGDNRPTESLFSRDAILAFWEPGVALEVVRGFMGAGDF
jgi:hypothetical protein